MTKLNIMILESLPNQWGYSIKLKTGPPPMYIDASVRLELKADKDLLMAFKYSIQYNGSGDLHIFLCIYVLIEVRYDQQPSTPPHLENVETGVT